MAAPTKSIDYRLRYPDLHQSIHLWFRTIRFKKSVVLMLMFAILAFMAALYYVEQQVRLRTLNYEIIELKKQKKVLLEQRKTLQLKLDQAKRLDKIEVEMTKEGFIPVEKEQIRIVQ